jgi:hypothetical protein
MFLFHFIKKTILLQSAQTFTTFSDRLMSGFSCAHLQTTVDDVISAMGGPAAGVAPAVDAVTDATPPVTDPSKRRRRQEPEPTVAPASATAPDAPSGAGTEPQDANATVAVSAQSANETAHQWLRDLEDGGTHEFSPKMKKAKWSGE